MPNWTLGRLGQVYAKVESSYGTAPTFAATDAFRHLNLSMHDDPASLTKSPERHVDPSIRAMLTRRHVANWGVKGQMYPSGTLNTAPEADVFLTNGIGSKVSRVLSTTVASGAGVGGAVLTSAGALAPNDMVQIIVLGGSAPGTYIRMIKTVATNTVTWSPDLPATCAASDTVKGMITYVPTTTLPASLDIAHYPQAPGAWYNREMLGCVIDKMVFSVDSNSEPMIDCSGPAQGLVAAGAQGQAGGFTTVGAEGAIPSGLTGYFNYGATLYQIEKFELTLANAMLLQNTALGTSKAVAYLRNGQRLVTGKINAKVSSDLTLWTPSLTPGSSTIMVQVGITATKIWAFYIPVAQLLRPADVPDGNETNNWDFEFQALSTAGNDEVFVGQG